MTKDMRSKVLLEKDGNWSVVPCKIKGGMLETGEKNFKHPTEDSALLEISEDYEEMQNEFLPMIFGDFYRRVFVHKEDLP